MPRHRDLFERAVAVCRQLNDPEMLARSLFALGAIDMSRGELQSVEAISLRSAGTCRCQSEVLR